MTDPPQERRSFFAFIVLHAALGFALGTAVAAMLVLFDVGGLKQLLVATGEPYAPLFFFAVNCAATGAVVKLSHAVITMPYDEPLE